MKFGTMKDAMDNHDAMQELASLHHMIKHGDLGLDLNGLSFEGVTDETWDKAITAARKVLLTGVKAEYDERVAAIIENGVSEVPDITDWPKPERPL